VSKREVVDKDRDANTEKVAASICNQPCVSCHLHCPGSRRMQISDQSQQRAMSSRRSRRSPAPCRMRSSSVRTARGRPWLLLLTKTCLCLSGCLAPVGSGSCCCRNCRSLGIFRSVFEGEPEVGVAKRANTITNIAFIAIACDLLHRECDHKRLIAAM